VKNLDLSIDKQCDWTVLESFLDKNAELDVDEIKKAYEFAKKSHQGQKRESGEDYLCHPLWIAKVVAQMGLDGKAIEAALLHDCVEDTEVTLMDIASSFGDEVALLVEGLTEVKRKTKEIEIHQTSITVFRHFLFSSVNDVRILIIRLIDKLHNGLTIGPLSKERKLKYAQRVFGIYGPVAEYVGLHYFKRLIEDIAFEIMYPEDFARITKMLEDRKRDEIKALANVTKEIEELLAINRINECEVESRIKSKYGTFLKEKKHREFAAKDRVGIRIITQTVPECYMILGLIHSRFRYIEDEFNDYISSPKPNGYRSIQTTFEWKNNVTVEVQIRTKDMHDFNEFGPASHIAYKFKLKGNGGSGYEWVRDLVKWQKDNANVSNYKISVLEKYIYVFTPKGDTIQLPKGSTVLDFAYRIHSNLGDRFSLGKVNNKVSKIDTVLKTGDMVEIVTTKKLNVNRNWLDFAKTSHARERIKRLTEEL